MKKALLATSLSLTLLASVALPTSANSQDSIQSSQKSSQKIVVNDNGQNVVANVDILQDDNKIRKVKVTVGNNTSIVEYDKVSQVFTINENGAISKIDQRAAEMKLSNNKRAAAKDIGDYDLIDSYSEWWYDSYYDIYYYDKVNRYFWAISNGDRSKTTWETSSNASDLKEFRSTLNTLRSHERSAEVAAGVIATSVTAAVLSAPATAGIGTIIGLAVGAGATMYAAEKYWNAVSTYRDLRYVYARVTIQS
ncbi:hypothetical protein BRE01_60430 [Brevibacillus reuszeri]|uniref:Uncharacterized protein n=1 Tax=Brevibacillus reuszeri TaxID=54915 RepID=A0A0K9YN93_9BACL|nr:geobacillin-26 family protein [Brevibacillus reuszeri]KNB70213.1 hypothetical protein ADS79_14690 [Brevibacillus reuszeri]MED1859169.1 geobacillin-26 family protein [Brevibacillus reuszeri]GED72341.1 hypothetical protein BRE01_60430 [Brevibacillus reuszeri]